MDSKGQADADASEAEIELDDEDFWALDRGDDSDDYESDQQLDDKQLDDQRLDSKLLDDNHDFIPIEDLSDFHDFMPTSAQRQRAPSPLVIPDSDDDWDGVEVI
jgi:hypothetical protein